MHLSKDICHLITRFQLQTKSQVFRSALKAPAIFMCQHYFARNFVNYEVKKPKEAINVVLTFKEKVKKNQVITTLAAVTDPLSK